MKSFLLFLARSFLAYMASVLIMLMPAYWLITSRLVGGDSVTYAVPGVGYWLALGWPQRAVLILKMVVLPEAFRAVLLGAVLFLVRPLFRKAAYWGALLLAAALLLLGSLNQMGEFLRHWIVSVAAASAPGWEHPSRSLYLLIAETYFQYAIFGFLLIAWEKRGSSTSPSVPATD